MYLHLGGEYLVKTTDIIGIFDLDTTTVSKVTRDFLSKAEKNKNIIYTSTELPKSFVVCDDKIYISQLATPTLYKRMRNFKRI